MNNLELVNVGIVMCLVNSCSQWHMRQNGMRDLGGVERESRGDREIIHLDV